MELLPDTLAALTQSDPDRVRAAQLASPDDRAALTVVYAFHAELAKVPELVSQPLLGSIRYQWWRDCVEEIYAGLPVRKHEVALPLADLVKVRSVSRFRLDQLIDGRERDLDPRPFADLDAARDYSRATSGALMRLAVAVLGGEADAGVDTAGEAWGLCGLARGYRFYRHTMLQHLRPDALLDAALESHGRAGRIPSAVMPAVAYAALVPGYVKVMRKPGFDPVKSPVRYGALAKQARLMRAAVSGRL